MKIAAVIVAAGRSSRFFSGNKLLAEIDRKPVIRHVISAVDAAPVDDIVLVTAPGGDAVLAAAGAGRWRSVVNADAKTGMSSSIRAGLSSLDAATDGAFIVLADMPRITTALIEELRAAFLSANGKSIVFPQTLAGRQGNPVLWPRTLFAELLKLEGDVGAKSLLSRHTDRHCPVFVHGDAALFDIDTAADLAAAKI